MLEFRERLNQPSVAVALDIGGTKLAAGIVDNNGKMLGRAQVPTPATGTAEDLFDAVCELLEPFVSSVDADVLGVGCGGPMSDDGGLLSPLNIPAWRDFALRDRLTERFSLRCAVDNDAKALAVAEGCWGAATGLTNYLAMVVSTGVGGGLVIDGTLLNGGSGNAGHVGHVIVEPDGADCVCGSQGCLEAEASGTAIAHRTGRPAKYAPLEERARAGRMVGRGVASLMAALDFRVALVAGSVALGFGHDFFGPAQLELERTARIGFLHDPRVVAAGLGADGPLMGAAAVGFMAHGERTSR